MMETLRSSETPFLTRATRRNIPEGGILYEVMDISITEILFEEN
jgi:hypothetical protein